MENGLTETYPLGDALGFLRELWALAHAMERTSKRMEATLGVTAQQRVALRIVGRFPGITPGALARLLHVDASTVSAALRRLEARGLLTRRRDTRDKRRIAIGLTEEGRRVDAPAAGTIENAVDEVLRRTPLAERNVALSVVERLRGALEGTLVGAAEAPE